MNLQAKSEWDVLHPGRGNAPTTAEVTEKVELMVNLNSIELFSGAGGLALGMAQSGFHHQMLVELNPNAINTLRLNHNAEWNIIHGNVADISFQEYENQIELLAGGPPCQPFSLGGNHKGYQDSRDMFPQAPTQWIYI